MHQPFEGTVNQISPEDAKAIIFNSFPLTWQQDYALSGCDYATQTVEQIVQYMPDKKIQKDREEDKKKRGQQPRLMYRGGYMQHMSNHFGMRPQHHYRPYNTNRVPNRRYTGRFGPPAAGWYGQHFNHGGRMQV